MYNLKRDDTNEFNYKIERLTVSENKFMVAVGDRCGTGIVRGFLMDMYTLLYLKWISNKEPLYSRWNSARCYVAV